MNLPIERSERPPLQETMQARYSDERDEEYGYEGAEMKQLRDLA